MKDYVNSAALQEYTTKLVAKLKTLFPGTPTAAATVADMTDHSKTYVYVGSETGYTAGDWYYWDGTAWTSGGPFQATSIITDTTLAVAGEAADAKATGDAIAAAKTAVLNAMAPAYSTSATYAVGDYVNYNGSIYRCSTAITTAESWTSGHWTAVVLGADLASQVSDLKTQITNVNSVIFTETDNQIDFTQDFGKWVQGYPGGSQGYAIHLDEKIEAEAGQIVYGRIKAVTLERMISLNIRPYNSNDEMIVEYNVATSAGGSWPYTFPENTAYYYISLTTSSASYPITPSSVKALNLEIYCGPTNVTADNIYPKYEPINETLNKEVLSLSSDIENNTSEIDKLKDAVLTITDNQVDFTQDFDKWKQGYPGGSQGYAIHLDEKIEAEAGQIVYGRIKAVTLERMISLNIRPYNSNDEMIVEYNVATSAGGSWPYTFPENTAYYYISLTTSSASYPITPSSVKALNLEIYCGPTNVTADNIYPKYETIDYKIAKTNSDVEKIEETVANNSEYGSVSAIDSGENVHFFGPHEKSYTVVSTSDNWKADSYVIINPEFNVGDYVAIKCEAYHGYGTNGATIVCKDANNVNTLSVTLLRDQLNENGFITKYFQIPANTTSVICTLYGVSNTSDLPDADKPVVGDVTIIKGAYAIVAKSVPQIDPLFRIDEQPETLWNEEDDTRENHEDVYSSSRIGYIFLTDLHVDYEDNPTGTAFQKNQLKLACDIANCSDIDFLVLGGDYIDGKGTRATATKWMRWITAGLKTINKPVIVCRGNHDKNNNANPAQAASEQISTEAFYAIMQAPFRRPEYIYDDNATVPELYFYYDIPRKKTRIIAYDSIFCDNPDEQIKWICEQALNKPDAGWKFIIVTHVPFNNQYNTGGMNWVAHYGDQMEGIITALNNRTTYTGTAGTYSISVDFSAYQSSVICISTGHEHTGLITWDSDTDCFFTTTGCGSANGGYGTFNDSSVVRDDAQTTNRNNMAFDNPLKYCFDLLSVSAESTTRSRFGNGVDKTVDKP